MKKILLLVSIIFIAAPAQAFFGEKVRRMDPKAACAALKVKDERAQIADARLEKAKDKVIRELDKIEAQNKLYMTSSEFQQWMKTPMDKFMDIKLLEGEKNAEIAVNKATLEQYDAFMPVLLHLGYKDAEIIEARKKAPEGEKWKEFFKRVAKGKTKDYDLIYGPPQLETKQAASFCRNLGIPLPSNF